MSLDSPSKLDLQRRAAPFEFIPDLDELTLAKPRNEVRQVLKAVARRDQVTEDGSVREFDCRGDGFVTEVRGVEFV